MGQKQDEYGSLTIRYKRETEVGEVIQNFRQNVDNRSDTVRRLIYFSHGYSCIKGRSQEEIRKYLIEGIKFFSGELAALESYLRLQSKYPESETFGERQEVPVTRKKNSLVNSLKL